MQVSSLVTDGLTDTRQRVAQLLSIKLSDHKALYLSLATGSHAGRDIVDFSCGGGVRIEALANLEKIMLNDDEFCVMFGATELGHGGAASHSVPRATAALAGNAEFVKLSARLEAALATTLCEPQQKANWKRDGVRATALVALTRTGDAIRCLSAVVGGIVPGVDMRRVDDLKSSLEDEGLDVMLHTQLLETVSGLVAS